VGHVARTFEEAGIATTAVYVRAFRHVAEQMRVPRVVVTRHPVGRPLGAPGDQARQREVVEAALSLFDIATEGPTVLELEEPYRVPGPTSS
jgi:hypothetical protein